MPLNEALCVFSLRVNVMKPRDKFYVLVALICWLWFAVISASGCEVLDSPFGFVSGCYNYGVNWNAFMAPSGFLVFLAVPICLIYFLYRVAQLLYMLLKIGINKLLFKVNT